MSAGGVSVSKPKNGTIELCRFIFIAAICIMHFCNTYFGSAPRFGAAYTAVEFFFIVSGYLLFKYFYEKRDNGKGAFSYTFSRIKKLYPYYIIAFLLIFICIMIDSREGIIGWIINLGGSFFELVFLHISGLKCFRLFNYPTWYISAMLIAGYFIYACLEQFGDKFVKAVMPILVIIIYVDFSRNSGCLDVWGGARFGVSDAVARGFAGMSIGGMCYFVVNKLIIYFSENKNTDWLKIPLSILEIFCFGMALFLMHGMGGTQADFYVIPLLAAGITLSFSQITSLSAATNKTNVNRLCVFLGKLSYPMFLNQILLIYIVSRLEKLGYVQAVGIYIAALIVFSFVFMKAIDFVCDKVLRRQ